jgi:hypothetical protein
MRALIFSVLAFIAGATLEKKFHRPAIGEDAEPIAGPAKVIDWRPADRYDFTVEKGEVFRLDRATGTVHIMRGDLSFDVPEYRDGDGD